ncbi:MAG: hypothetical protein KF749_09905, partial [Bacteroidetes bacterium]|nr:hypothetical protein [Bacteroidota bacterium]
MRQPDASFLREIQKAKKALVEARLRSKQGKNSAARMRYRYAIDTWKSVVIHHSIFQRDLENAIPQAAQARRRGLHRFNSTLVRFKPS